MQRARPRVRYPYIPTLSGNLRVGARALSRCPCVCLTGDPVAFLCCTFSMVSSMLPRSWPLRLGSNSQASLSQISCRSTHSFKLIELTDGQSQKPMGNLDPGVRGEHYTQVQ